MTTNDLNPPPESSANAVFAEGQKLAGCYALLRQITSGAGPDVWLADDEVLGKNVTLHVLPEAVVKDGRALQELRSDIKRIRQLIHPQILRVFDLIEEPEWAAVSMNAFEGESLASLRTHQPNQRFVAAAMEPWLFKMLQAVDDAHRINFLHRDLAPENIYLTPDSQPLVANFGISRTIQDALARAGKADPSREAYVSPQVLDGTAAARTDDVYSLGAVLYTLLVGLPPFADAAQVRAGVTAETLSALERADLQVPVTWQKAIAAALQKSPGNRPQSATEFLKILKGEAPAPALPTPVTVKDASPAPSPAAAAKEEVAPKSVTTLRAEIPPSPEPVTARKLEAAPEPEAEIDESQALEELAKFDRSQTPAKPAPESSKPWSQRSEPKGAGAAGAGDLSAPSAPGPKKPADRLLAEFKPRLYPEESRFPVVVIGALFVILVLLVIYFLSTLGKKTTTPETAQTTPAAATPAPTPSQEKTTTPAPVVVVNTPPPSTPAPSTAGSAAQQNLQKDVTDMQAALGKAKQASDDAEKVHADRAKEQQTADAAVAASQKAFDEMTKANQPLKAVVDDLAAQRKKLEDSQKAAEAAAEDAQKVAAEKAHVVEEGKKALADLEKEGSEKMATQGKAAADLEALQKTLTEKQKVAGDAAQAATDADGVRQQQLATMTKLEQNLASAKATMEMSGSLSKKIENLENSQETIAKPPATPAPTPSVNFSDAPSKATPTQMAKLTTPAPTLTTPAPATPGPTPLPAAKPTPAPSTPAPATPASAPLPAVTPAVTTNAASSTGGNSLGMKFAPVGDVDFAIWLVRVKDFETFAKAVNLKSTSWESPGFRQGPDHPVVNVTWVEAVAFCKWLTDKEHKEGALPANQIYRLPSDLEWSKAVGLPAETGKTAEARDMDVPDVYPWGTEWPPPKGAGNYTGEETGSDVAIKGYDDGYAWTSPVGSFNANKYGLYDMGGNVWEWCEDSWNIESKAKVLRGASWYNGALKLSLLSSCRVHAAPDSSTDNYGFRIVRVSEGAAAVKGRFR